MALSKGMEEKDNPALVFSCETKDCPTFKDAIQMRADKHDTTWLFEGGRSLAEFFARQIKEKAGTKTTRTKALEREIVKTDSKHVPTSVDAYTVAVSRSGSRTRIATGLQLSLNKNRLRKKFRDGTWVELHRLQEARFQGRGRAHKSPQVH
jgi:hypothetical protein